MNGGPAVELWGGVECTVNRLGDRFADQVRLTGHEHRSDDLDRFATLGIQALRYPVLWERVAREGLDTYDWHWTDQRLMRLRALGIRPIATLLHHGSGPPSTDLLDPGFASAFAAYAGAVAARYPWLDDYTPINEPLTTARFSALYGHWYPHRRDSAAFVQALLHQVSAIVRAMRAIRLANPRARLIQTEDAGRVYSTGPLAYQASFENQRRWLTFDLLAGHVDRHHPLRAWLAREGADHRLLDELVDEPLPADLLGLNYYLTSDRYLDHRWELFDAGTHGTNGRHRYADVEAVRMLPAGLRGHAEVLLEAWRRYGTPVALTEVHAGATIDDQIRWLLAAWRGAQSAQDAGADVRAVTLWALLGNFDWNSLLTRQDGIYEPGAFDVRSSPPRATALAEVAAALAAGAPVSDYAESAAWWKQAGRMLPAATRNRPDAQPVAI